MRNRSIIWWVSLIICVRMILQGIALDTHQPLSKIAIHKSIFALDNLSYINVTPSILGLKGETSEWVSLVYGHSQPSNEDWIGVFSPSKFNASTYASHDFWDFPPLYTSPIKFQNASYSNHEYTETGRGEMKLQLINQRSDFSFALFTGGFANIRGEQSKIRAESSKIGAKSLTPKLVAVSNPIAFANPKFPSYPRLAQGKLWNEMTVTWTSGYGIDEAEPFVEWGRTEGQRLQSPAGTLTFHQNSMCGPPARTVGWRDPGYIHTGFMKELWPNSLYSYRMGHRLLNGTYVWSKTYEFKSSPYPGQNSLQQVVIFGDMGKDEIDGSNEYNQYQRGSLNTTKQLINDLKNIDIVFHIGDISYANGYISQWDQFTAQMEPIASTVPYMVASGNHERDWPGTGSFYGNSDSGGECGVAAQTIFYTPAENRANFWYSTDYGMFRFCIANTEEDWREGTEQYKFIEHCLASVDRMKQPWLIFLAHRVLGYSSCEYYSEQGSFGEPMGRDSLQKLWQKYKVDIAIFGHVHSYERTCPIYQHICTREEKDEYKGPLNGTIHVVAGGAGAILSSFPTSQPRWSLYRDFDFGFVKLTAFNHSSLLFEYKKSRDGRVYDSFKIQRDYRDILACYVDSCPATTLAS